MLSGARISFFEYPPTHLQGTHAVIVRCGMQRSDRESFLIVLPCIVSHHSDALSGAYVSLRC